MDPAANDTAAQEEKQIDKISARFMELPWSNA
jgi:hypothetical protein